MGYDRGDIFSLDFEPNGIPFGSKPKGKLLPRSYPIQCERKWNTSFLSAVPQAWLHCNLQRVPSIAPEVLQMGLNLCLYTVQKVMRKINPKVPK